VDSELELSPPGEKVPILDSRIHQHLFEGTSGSGRRGRPDIVHRFLFLCLDSRPGRQGRVRPFVHTRNGRIIEVHPEASLPWNYFDFLEKMGFLLKGREIEGFSLRRETNLEELISHISCDAVIALSPEGKDTPLNQVYMERELEQVTILIGGFSEGDYVSNVHEHTDIEISLGKGLLKVWTVTCEVLASLGHE